MHISHCVCSGVSLIKQYNLVRSEASQYDSVGGGVCILIVVAWCGKFMCSKFVELKDPPNADNRC